MNYTKTINNMIYALVISAFLLPREYNFRYSGISISLTDIIFAAVLLYFIIIKYKDVKTLIKDNYNKAILGGIALLAVIVVFQTAFKGVESQYFFVRFLYSYLAIIAFLISYNLNLKIKLSSFVLLLFCLYLILSLYSMAIFEVPIVFRFYVKQFVKYKAMAREIGYGLSWATRMERQYLRTGDLIGGFGHIGWASFICLPLFVAFFSYLKRKMSTIILFLAFVPIFMSVFYLMSRSVFAGLIIAFINIHKSQIK